MNSRFAYSLLSLLLLAVAVSADAGDVILHPNGFGEHSYAAWKAQQGLPDSTGAKNQSLYFQKMTTTPTFAAGVAVFQGIEGLPVSQLTGLEFWWRMDGHCGAGAPRFNVRVDMGNGVKQTLFIGCAGMVPAGMATANGQSFQRRILPAPFAMLFPGVTGTITSLSIVFDEGDDVGPGFVYLDNITVQTSPMAVDFPTKTWTSASDNGNQ